MKAQYKDSVHIPKIDRDVFQSLFGIDPDELVEKEMMESQASFIFDFNGDAFYCEHCKRNVSKVIMNEYDLSMLDGGKFVITAKTSTCHKCKRPGTLKNIQK